MRARTLTVDTQGLYFTLKVLAVCFVCLGSYYVFAPYSDLVLEDTQHVIASNEPEPEPVSGGLEDRVPDETIERLLDAAHGTMGLQGSGGVYYLAPERGRFIDVDLVRNEVSLYEDGARQSAYTVREAPHVGAAHAIPAGTYAVEASKEFEVSTVAMVRFPSYVRFGGTYALHGEPTDAAGEPLAEPYAGASVLLENDDAARVMAFAQERTPVSVRTDGATPPFAPYVALVVSKKEVPATSARAYAIADLARGQVVLEKNEDERYPVASVTKLTTALVANDLIGYGSEVKAPSGDVYVLGDLYYPLLMRSDNGVANKLAAHVGEARFIENMNAYAAELGMLSTHYADPSGLSPKNTSTAADLVILARHLYNSNKYLLDISKEASMTITSVSGTKWAMTNQNKLAGDPHFRGGKLGFTDEAGQTALSIFNVPIDGEVHAIAVIILGSQDWKQDTRTLLRWLLLSVKEGGEGRE